MPSGSTSLPTLDPRDRQAIVDATVRYCWAIDARDFDALDQVFTHDVECDYAPAADRFTGLEALKRFLSQQLEGLDLTQHLVANHLVEPSEEGPVSRCYFQAQHVKRELQDGPHYLLAGFYVDRWRLTEEGWRSFARRLEFRWAEGNPSVVDRRQSR